MPLVPYHLHLDATVLPEELDQELAERFGFAKTDFCGHPPNYQHFEPVAHRTRKFDGAKELTGVFDELVGTIGSRGFVGYIEAEYIRSETHFASDPFQEGIEVPFRIERRRLRGPPEETFRQTELHLTLDRDLSDPRLIASLLKAGLYGAYIPKADHVALVLTAQGYKRDIEPLAARMLWYLENVGGIVRGRFKEERAIRHALIGVSPADLPEIIDRVVYHS